MINVITPNWPAAKNIKAFTTTRHGGVSQQAFASLNLANHVGDDTEAVKNNRALLRAQMRLPNEPVWINQVHGVEVVQADIISSLTTADASFTNQPNIVCVVMTADCLPVFFCNKAGTHVAVAHAGWRGLVDGVIEETIKALKIPGNELLVWLGPAIGPQAFEVGEEVLQKFCAIDPQAEAAFKTSPNNRWLGDIYLLAKQRLQKCGVTAIYGGDLCTYSDSEQFFSYRRDGQTGRMASLIWIT
jgi:YfiH family protein